MAEKVDHGKAFRYARRIEREDSDIAPDDVYNLARAYVEATQENRDKTRQIQALEKTLEELDPDYHHLVSERGLERFRLGH